MYYKSQEQFQTNFKTRFKSCGGYKHREGKNTHIPPWNPRKRAFLPAGGILTQKPPPYKWGLFLTGG